MEILLPNITTSTCSARLHATCAAQKLVAMALDAAHVPSSLPRLVYHSLLHVVSAGHPPCAIRGEERGAFWCAHERSRGVRGRCAGAAVQAARLRRLGRLPPEGPGPVRGARGRAGHGRKGRLGRGGHHGRGAGLGHRLCHRPRQVGAPPGRLGAGQARQALQWQRAPGQLQRGFRRVHPVLLHRRHGDPGRPPSSQRA